ncbi:hypothetical protein QTP86_008006 [Hemibagrus guttatus]|nr:hypothetical protein QTP86_008006 [Hemibagrus guttatus]
MRPDDFYPDRIAFQCKNKEEEFKLKEPSVALGFTGYVPRARFLMGSSFPITTNKALIQFGKQMKASHSALGLTRESDDNLVSAPTIYPTHRGLLPRYTGHVPADTVAMPIGYRFRYGQTFGQLTSNSLDLSSTRKKINSE